MTDEILKKIDWRENLLNRKLSFRDNDAEVDDLAMIALQYGKAIRAAVKFISNLRETSTVAGHGEASIVYLSAYPEEVAITLKEITALLGVKEGET